MAVRRTPAQTQPEAAPESLWALEREQTRAVQNRRHRSTGRRKTRTQGATDSERCTARYLWVRRGTPGGTSPQLCCVALPDTHRQFHECTNFPRAGSSPIPTALSSLSPRPRLVPAQPIAARLPAATGGSVQLIYAAVVAIRSRCTVGLEIGARNPSRYVKSGKEATTAHPFPRISCSRRSYPTGLLRVTVRGSTACSTVQTSAALTAPNIRCGPSGQDSAAGHHRRRAPVWSVPPVGSFQRRLSLRRAGFLLRAQPNGRPVHSRQVRSSDDVVSASDALLPPAAASTCVAACSIERAKYNVRRATNNRQQH